MADVSLIQDDSLDDSDEGVFEQGESLWVKQTDDETLPPLVRIQKYAFSENVFDRRMVPRILLELFRSGPADLLTADLPCIMRLLSQMAEEDEIMVRTIILEQVSNLAVTALECSSRIPELNNLFNDHLLPLILRNLGTNDNQVRKTAQSNLLNVVEKGLVTQEQAEMQVCPAVLALSHIQSVVDYLTGTVTLMSMLAPYFGRDITERMFLHPFSQLCSNQMFYVRKMCASQIGDFCAVIGKDAYEHILLPRYIALCSDDIWGVRKACAEVVMSVSCACPALKRHSCLAPVFARLLQDPSRWVRMSAFQTLGPFISTFADPTITNIAYNNSRELVLVNNDGTEFRISPTDSDVDNIRWEGELHTLYQLQEREEKDWQWSQPNFSEKDDDDDVIFNPLLDPQNSLSGGDCGEQMQMNDVASELCLEATEEEEEQQQHEEEDGEINVERKNEEASENQAEEEQQETEERSSASIETENDQELSPASPSSSTNGGGGGGDNEPLDIIVLLKKVMLDFSVSVDIDKEDGNSSSSSSSATTTNRVIDENEIGTSNSNTCDNNLDDKSSNRDVSELSENVRYTDLLNNEHNYALNDESHLIISKSDKNDDHNDDHNHSNGDISQEIPLSLDIDEPTNQNSNCTATADGKKEIEPLDQYNSYNYWYISPDMPLDPTVISPQENNIAFKEEPMETLVKSEIFYANHLMSGPFYSNDQGGSELNENSSNTWEPMPYPKMDKFPMYIEHHLNNNNNNTTEKREGPSKEMPPPSSPMSMPLATTPNHNLEEALLMPPPSQRLVPQLLIDHFVSMTDPNLAQNTDNEMAYHCAYSLPAVALTLGSKNWHLLKDTVEVLAANMQYKVRRTVASSLHELAMILGPDIATNNLTPIFEGFFKDLDEVRIGILKHLAHFLRLISPSKRNVYLPRLAEFLKMDNIANWRFRQELAEQLLMAVPLFRPSDTAKHISPISQELLCDKVAAVREVALLLVTELVRHISSDPTLTSRLLVKLAEQFAHSKRWKLRQSFALLCSELLTSKALPAEQFASEVMPHLLDLSWDPVPNVRLVVARTISQHIVTIEYFADVSNQHYDGLQTVLRRLQSDKDRDVRQSAILQRLTSIQ